MKVSPLDLREVDRLRQDVVKLEALLSQHREHERGLRDTLFVREQEQRDRDEKVLLHRPRPAEPSARTESSVRLEEPRTATGQ